MSDDIASVCGELKHTWAQADDQVCDACLQNRVSELLSRLRNINQLLRSVEIHQVIQWQTPHLKNLFYGAIEAADAASD